MILPGYWAVLGEGQGQVGLHHDEGLHHQHHLHVVDQELQEGEAAKIGRGYC